MKAAQAYDPTVDLRLKDKDAIIHFEEGLIGFSECRQFVAIDVDV